MITRINVPIFFMISGALLLNKEECLKQVIKKRISKVVFIVILFEATLYLTYKILHGALLYCSLQEFIYGVLEMSIPWTSAYWFLYAYIGFLFMLPFMRSVAKNLKFEGVACLIGLHFIFSTFFPILNMTLSFQGMDLIIISGHFQVPLATIKAFFYTLVGFYLDKYIDIKSLKFKYIALFIIAALLGIIASSICTYFEGIATGVFTQNYVQLFDYVTAISVFMLIKWLFCKKLVVLSEGLYGGIICFIGSLTFGIYLLDPLLKMLIYSKYEFVAEPYLPTVFVSIGWVLISMIIGGALTLFLKHLPLTKKLI